MLDLHHGRREEPVVLVESKQRVFGVVVDKEVDLALVESSKEECHLHAPGNLLRALLHNGIAPAREGLQQSYPKAL